MLYMYFGEPQAVEQYCIQSCHKSLALTEALAGILFWVANYNV